MPGSVAPASDALQGVGIIGGGFNLDGVLTVEPPVQIAHDVVLYETNHVGQFSYVCAGGRILQATIGRYCSIAEHVAVGLLEHPMDRLSTHPFAYNWGLTEKDEPRTPFWDFEAFRRIVGRDNLRASAEAPRTEIGNDVWIGRMATIKSGVRIGHGAVIGAHAVVTRDVEPYAVVAGAPARVIRKRFDDKMIADLLALAWWDYDLGPLRDKPGYSDVAGFMGAMSRMRETGEVQRIYPARHKLLNDNGVLQTLPYAG